MPRAVSKSGKLKGKVKGKRNQTVRASSPYGLTPFEQRFVDAYVECGHLAEAYKKASLKERSVAQSTASVEGSRTLKRPLVAAAVRSRIALREQETGWDRDKIELQLRRNCLQAMQAIPVLDKHGNPTGEYQYDGAVANRSLELLAKMRGYLSNRLELTGTVKHKHSATVRIDPKDLPTETLHQLLEIMEKKKLEQEARQLTDQRAGQQSIPLTDKQTLILPDSTSPQP